jgi:hypothetical protein
MAQKKSPAALAMAGADRAVVWEVVYSSETTAPLQNPQLARAARWLARRHFLRMPIAAIVAVEVGLGGAQ